MAFGESGSTCLVRPCRCDLEPDAVISSLLESGRPPTLQPRLSKSVAEIRVKVLADLNLCLILFRGIVDVESLAQLRASYDPRPTRDVLIVYADAQVGSGVSTDVIRNYSAASRGAEHEGRRSCIVVDSETEFGLARLFGTYTSLGGSSTQYHVCRTIDAAVEWLDLDGDIVRDALDQLHVAD